MRFFFFWFGDGLMQGRKPRLEWSSKLSKSHGLCGDTIYQDEESGLERAGVRVKGSILVSLC